MPAVTPDAAGLFAEARRDGGGSASKVALARLITMVERGGDVCREVARLAFPLSGTAYTVGVTGAPGAGKSTLTDALIARLRADGPVAVLAIDPTSPFSGGAILGDRVRMSGHYADEDVYIRSMATRGHMGGLAFAVPETVRLLDAVGFSTVVIETVGVGQVEVEVTGAADTTVVVVNPGWGDAVQASKAGLMEVADVFAVNKADRPGTKETVRDLEGMLDLAHPGGWRPPVVTAVATTGEGVDELDAAIRGHREHLAGTGELEARRAQRIDGELAKVVHKRLESAVSSRWSSSEGERLRARTQAREIDLDTAADEIVRSVLGGVGNGE